MAPFSSCKDAHALQATGAAAAPPTLRGVRCGDRFEHCADRWQWHPKVAYADYDHEQGPGVVAWHSGSLSRCSGQGPGTICMRLILYLLNRTACGCAAVLFLTRCDFRERRFHDPPFRPVCRSGRWLTEAEVHGSHCGARHSSITHSLTGLFRYVVYSKSIFGLTELSVRHAGLTWHFAASYGRVDSQDYTEISIYTVS